MAGGNPPTSWAEETEADHLNRLFCPKERIAHDLPSQTIADHDSGSWAAE